VYNVTFFLFMKNIYIILFFLAFVSPIYCQDTIIDKFWVAFTDKNGTSYSIENPSEYLSQRAIDRRIRYSIPIMESDLPVNQDYVDSLKKLGVNVLHTSKWLNSAVIETTDSGCIHQIRQLPFVSSILHLARNVSAEGVKHKALSDKFGFESLDYGLAATQIMIHQGDKLHDWGFLGQDMVIAVLDAGFNGADTLRAFDSLRLNGQILGTKDFVKPGNDVYHEYPHGMSVLSIMGGNLPGELVGTAPGASYWLLRSEDVSSEQKIEELNWVAAAEFADSVGADIINSSLGYSEFDDTLQNYTYENMDGNTAPVTRGADMAASKGILVVVSAGNSGNKPWYYITAPADGDSVMAVGAVDPFLCHVEFCSHGPTSDGRIKPDVVALGYGTFMQVSDGSVAPGAGTSFSAPIISGLAACLWQKFRDLSNYEIIKILEQSSSLYPYPDNTMGYGTPNLTVANDILTGNSITVTPEEFIISPNPAGSVIHVSVPSNAGNLIQYDIYDLAGRKTNLSGFFYGTNLTEFKVQSLNKIIPGIYILKITTDTGNYTIKFIKQ
jgi:serine protease AprX